MKILEKVANEEVQWRKLGEITKESFWLMPATPKFQEEGIPYITSKNIIKGKISFEDVKYIDKNDFERISQNRKIQKNDILITMIGKIGELAIVKEDVDFYGQNMYLVRLNNEIILDKYYYFYMTSDLAMRKIASVKNASTQGYIKASAITNLEIPIPSLELQEEIVEILDKFTSAKDELINELGKEKNLREKQYSYYRDMMLGEEYLHKIGEKYFLEKESLLRHTTLGEVGKFTRGNGLQKKDFVESGYPVVHYGEIFTKYGFLATKTFSYTSHEIFSKLRKAKPKDILIATTSENEQDVGKCVVWEGDEEVGFSGDMYSFSTRENSRYIAYFFQTYAFQRQKERKISGTKLIRLHSDDMEKIKITLPPLDIQQKVVEVLDKLRELSDKVTGLLPLEIDLRQKQYEYYREKLLNFKR